MPKSDNVTISVRMPPEQMERLNDIAVTLDRSRNWIINRAVEAYLRQQDELRTMIDEGDTSGDPEPLEDIETFLRRARERQTTRKQQLNQAS